MTTTTDLAYRGDPDLKSGLVAEAEQHRAQDRLLQGEYYRNGSADWKGCAVGCTVADRVSAEELRELRDDQSWHATWADVTGLPEWLAHAEDRIFEGLPVEDARQWPVRLLTAIPVGIDLTPVREAWLRDLVFDTEHGALAIAAAALEAAGAAGDAARMQGVSLSPEWSASLTEQATLLRGIPPTADWESASDAAGSARAAAGSASAAAGSASDAAGSASAAAWQWISDRLIHHLESASQPLTP